MCFENQQKCLGPQDLDAFVTAEIEDVHILGDDKPGASDSRRREELVILRITTDRWSIHRLHDNGLGDYLQDCGEIARLDLVVLSNKLRAVNDSQVFGNDG